MDKAEEIVLSALYVLDEIWGRTYLQKFIFLINRELYNGDIFRFRSYKYGPFCDAINNIVSRLNEINMIHEKPVLTKGYKTGYKYSLTKKGKKIAQDIFNDKISKKEKNIIIEYKDRFGNYSPTDLLKYVYQKYPTYIENSEFEK
jgi:hypothetical protein